MVQLNKDENVWVSFEMTRVQNAHAVQRLWPNCWPGRRVPIIHAKLKNYAGINLTGYHPPPGLTPGPLIFSVKIPALGTAFQCKTPVCISGKKRNKIPTPGHKLPSSNAKISMKKEHNSIRAVSLQIFHNCPFDNFLLS